MEIINGYGGTIGLTPSNILSSDIATGDVSETKSSKIFFFTGDMDLNSLYNISSESQLLTSYSSTYLGTVTTDLTYKYLKNAKKNIIKMSTPNARRFKDVRYSNSTYALGTTFTKPSIGTKYKFKFTNSTVNDGFLLNGSSISTNVKKDYYRTYTDGFDALFANGTSVNGGAIDLVNNQLYGYRVDGSGPDGYISVPFSVLKNQGLTVIECNVTLNTCGWIFVGYAWNNQLTSSYGNGSTKITIDFVNMTVTNTAPYNGTPSTVSLVGLDLSTIYIGICAIQASAGWVPWNVVIPNSSYYTYDIESDFFTTTGNITVTNPTALTHSGFEVIPYGEDDKPLSNQINWCAIKVGNNTLGDKLIFTNDIGTFINPSFVNLSKRECVYGIDNILHSLKIEVSEKGN